MGETKTADYAGNKIYEGGNLQKILIDNGYIENGIYYFYVRDHLGNNRIVADASGNVIQKTDYYPFGMPTSASTAVDAQPYKYNGKEYDMMNGLNQYDYHARQYDPAVIRFNTIDPHAESYFNWSPYAYCANNPINAVDFRGDSVTHVGSAADLQAVDAVHNNYLGGYYTVSTDPATGLSSMTAVTGTDPSTMTDAQKNYHAALDKVINGKGMATINVVNGTKDVIGDVTTATIDIGDIQALGNGTDINQGSALIHETYEQYGVQVQGKIPATAHIQAGYMESKITGVLPDPINRPLVGGNMTIPILNPFTKTVIKTVTIHVNMDGNVTGITR